MSEFFTYQNLFGAININEELGKEPEAGFDRKWTPGGLDLFAQITAH